MSPSRALLRHFNIDCYVLVIIGLDIPVDVPSMKTTLQCTLIKHKRFSQHCGQYSLYSLDNFSLSRNTQIIFGRFSFFLPSFLAASVEDDELQ